VAHVVRQQRTAFDVVASALERDAVGERAQPVRQKRRVTDPDVRFWKSAKWGEPSDFAPELGPCLLWTGADNGNGYGQFAWGDLRNGYAHRYAWERQHGTIPAGLTVDHLCRVRRCVNAEHMELVDGPENTRRAARSRTHCAKRHEYTPDNIKYRKGKRCCRTCLEATARRGAERRTNAYRGLPNRRIKFDQALVREVIAEIRAAQCTIAAGSRRIGCHSGYLGRRVWEETKADVIKRDGCCVVCGRSEGVILDVHHRIARGCGGASRPEIAYGMANLVTLCRQDHEAAEANPDEARATGLRVDRGVDPASIPVLRVESHRSAAYDNGWLVHQGANPREVPVLRRGQLVMLDDAGGFEKVAQQQDCATKSAAQVVKSNEAAQCVNTVRPLTDPICCEQKEEG
jgi:hypothetical protein